MTALTKTTPTKTRYIMMNVIVQWISVQHFRTFWTKPYA